ncbi:MAG: hypothetical protein U9P79_07590 [Candidatus Cloacimonadota bacterium]|nr:hypothetical protein [Candidatus Cloacimonadota bacterium]
MNFSDSIQKIDRRYIYIILAIVVILPLIFPLGLKTFTTPPVRNLYKTIDAAAGKPNKAVFMDFAQSPSTLPELYPMDIAILRHCFLRNIKVFTISYYPQGAAIIQMAIAEVKEEFPNIRQDVDYCNFGYKAWALRLPITLGMGDNISEAIETNGAGLRLDNLPIMKDIKNYDNIQICVEISGAAPGYIYITYARARFGVNVGIGVTAVSAADFYPYLQTGQLVGILGGLKGAAEYEELVETFAQNGLPYSAEYAENPTLKEEQYDLSKVPYKFKKARIGMDSQAIAHLLIILFIILGNIGYFLDRKNEKKKFIK